MKISKKFISIFFVLVLSATPITSVAENNYLDVPSSHWANNVINKWSGNEYSVLQGNGDGSFAPSRGLKLGELATILSKTFGYTERTVAEVTPNWADEYVEKSIAAGVITKSANINANATVSREQAIKYIALAYNIAPIKGNTTFVDDASIGAEYKPYVKAFQELGFIVGKGSNNFDPKSYYTRAEAMQVINNTTSEIIDKSVRDQNYPKTLIIRKSGVTVKDTTIKADLIVGQGVGDGEVTLDNVKIAGQLLAFGGGSNSITIKGEEFIPSTIANKTSGEPLHLNGKFGVITVTSGTKAIITGTVTKLIVLGNAEVTFTNAMINTLEVMNENVKIIVNKNSSIENIIVNANNVIVGHDGIVKNILVTEKAKNGVEVLTVPTKVTVEAKSGAVKIKNGYIQPGTTVVTSDSIVLHADDGSISISDGTSKSYTPSTGSSKSTPITPKTTFSLSVNNDTILIGEDSNQLYFYLETDLNLKTIPLYTISNGSENLVAEMYDDGNYNLHGDDMAGDGVYSAKYLSTASQDSVLSFIAKSETHKSNSINIKYYTPISDQVLESMERADEKIKKVTSSNEFLNGTEDKRKELVLVVLTDLAKDGMIFEESIFFSENSGVYSFQYVGGILGGVKIRDFKKDFNGNVSGKEYTLNLTNKELTDEKKQELWKIREQSNVPNPSNFSINTTNEFDKAIILNAFPAFETNNNDINFRTQFYVNLKSDWDQKGLQTTLDTDVTVEDFKNLSSYDVICISTHGTLHEWRDGFFWKDYHQYPAICLPEEATKASNKKYSIELKEKQLVEIDNCYWILPSFFENKYSSIELDEKFIFSESCQFKGANGKIDTTMSNAFESRSAEAVVGFHNSVLAVYSRNFMKSYVDELIAGRTTQEAFDVSVSTNGADDKGNPVAYPILSGRTDAKLVQTGLFNGDFESYIDMMFMGIPISWNREGDVRAVSKLGDVKSTGRMAFLTTGIGSKTTANIGVGTEGSIMSQSFIVPNNITTLNFDYNFISEEPMEFVGSEFNDSFGVHIKHKGTVVIDQIYESVNSSTWLNINSIDFSGGDSTVFQTDWKSATIDVSAYRGEKITLNFIVRDLGDSIYDSACLIDNVVLK